MHGIDDHDDLLLLPFEPVYWTKVFAWTTWLFTSPVLFVVAFFHTIHWLCKWPLTEVPETLTALVIIVLISTWCVIYPILIIVHYATKWIRARQPASGQPLLPLSIGQREERRRARQRHNDLEHEVSFPVLRAKFFVSLFLEIFVYLGMVCIIWTIDMMGVRPKSD